MLVNTFQLFANYILFHYKYIIYGSSLLLSIYFELLLEPQNYFYFQYLEFIYKLQSLQQSRYASSSVQIEHKRPHLSQRKRIPFATCNYTDCNYLGRFLLRLAQPDHGPSEESKSPAHGKHLSLRAAHRSPIFDLPLTVDRR